jgi:hypothetical protein
MLGLHLVLVTLHGQFTISIEEDEYRRIDDIKYNKVYVLLVPHMTVSR